VDVEEQWRDARVFDRMHAGGNLFTGAGLGELLNDETGSNQTMRYAHFAPSQVVDAMAVLNAKR
jgi:hypothetical protein